MFISVALCSINASWSCIWICRWAQTVGLGLSEPHPLQCSIITVTNLIHFWLPEGAVTLSSAKKPFINISTGQIGTKCPHGCLESSGGCPGAEPFNGLFMLWALLKTCCAEDLGRGISRGHWGRLSQGVFGVVKHLFGNFSVLAINRNGIGGKRCQEELLCSSLVLLGQ